MKIKILILSLGFLLIMMLATITANAEDEISTYPTRTESSTTYDVMEFAEIKIDNVWTTKYYAPNDYINVWICKNNIAAGYYLIYYDLDTTIACGSGTTYSKEVLYAKFDTLEEAQNALFEEKAHLDLSTMTSGPAWSKTFVYYYIEGSAQTTMPGYYKDSAVGIEQAYYDWYLAKYGEAPTLEEEIDEEGGLVGWLINIWKKLGELLEQRLEHTIAIIEKVGDVGAYIGEWFGTLFEKLENWFSETISSIKDIPTAIEALGKFVNFEYKLMNGSLFVEKTLELTNKALADNKFYTSVISIKNTLEDLYNEDYASRTGFYELGLTNLTIRKTTDTVYKDFGNETIGPWEQGTQIQTGNIDWGIQNAKVLNLDWYFGKDMGNGTYTKGLKPTIDAFISAFLWLAFAWGLYLNLPNIISGEITQLGNLITNTHDTNTSINTDTTQYTLETVDNVTGEYSSKTYTKKKGKGY